MGRAVLSRRGNAVKFSPHNPGRILVAAGAKLHPAHRPHHPNGCLYVFNINLPYDNLFEFNSFLSPGAIHDCSWSPHHPDLAVSGDQFGVVRIINTSHDPVIPQYSPAIATHPSSISSVDWSPFFPDAILAASTGSVKLWRFSAPMAQLHGRSLQFLRTFPCSPHHDFGHVVWSSQDSHQFAAACSDGAVSVWDINSGGWKPTHVLPHHLNQGKVISCDWNKIRSGNLARVATLSIADQCCIRVFELRLPNHPLFENFYSRRGFFQGTVGFSRHRDHVLYASSGDTVSLWDITRQVDPIFHSYQMCPNCVWGVDMSHHVEFQNLMACTGRYGGVAVWRH